MSKSQLSVVAAWEHRKEDKMVDDFRLAQQNVQSNKQKLSGLENYRLDYLRQVQQKAKNGIGSLTFGQHHQFIGKLDKACEMQVQALNKALIVADQRKAQWLQQQKKRKAVELLLEKQELEKQKLEQKQEQAMLDEMSLQKYLRK